MSDDFGDHCWGCEGHNDYRLGDMGEPLSIVQVVKDIARGWREADGTPKPQSFFLAGNPSFIKQVWPTDDPDAFAKPWPVEIWSELDADRREVRNITIWSDGRVRYSTRDEDPSGHMGKKPFPPLSELNAALPYHTQDVSREAFEDAWEKRPAAG